VLRLGVYLLGDCAPTVDGLVLRCAVDHRPRRVEAAPDLGFRVGISGLEMRIIDPNGWKQHLI
jgi:hypothetical protein